MWYNITWYIFENDTMLFHEIVPQPLEKTNPRPPIGFVDASMKARTPIFTNIPIRGLE